MRFIIFWYEDKMREFKSLKLSNLANFSTQNFRVRVMPSLVSVWALYLYFWFTWSLQYNMWNNALSIPMPLHSLVCLQGGLKPPCFKEASVFKIWLQAFDSLIRVKYLGISAFRVSWWCDNFPSPDNKFRLFKIQR